MSILESLHAVQIAGSIFEAAKEASRSKWGAARLIVGAGATVAGLVLGGIPGALLGLGASELFFQAAPAVWNWAKGVLHKWFGHSHAKAPETKEQHAQEPKVSQELTRANLASSQASIISGLGQSVGGLLQASHQVADEVEEREALSKTMNPLAAPVPKPSVIARQLEDELETNMPFLSIRRSM